MTARGGAADPRVVRRWLAFEIVAVSLVVAVSSDVGVDVLDRLAVGETASQAHTSGAEGPPSIVVFITDDEPALDRRFLDLMPRTRKLFKKRGVVFSDFHAATNVCCPSRATLLTGLRSAHHGVFNNGSARRFDPSETLAVVLREIGYHTILVGKYLNGWGDWGAPDPPPGWDHFAGLDEGDYFNYTLFVDGDPERHGGEAADYSTDVIADRAVRWLQEAPSEPIFLWIAVFAPHGPTIPAPRHSGAPCPAGTWQPPSWNEADVSDKPAYVRALPRLDAPDDETTACRTLLAVDELIGRVRAAAPERTIYFYVGDNGMHEGEHRLRGKQAPYVNRVPFMGSWPGRWRPNKVGERVQTVDFAPTVCDIAGCVLRRTDGLSFLRLLERPRSSLGRDAVLDEYLATENSVPPYFAVTTTSVSPLGRWHYIEYETGERELYDLEADPWELENRAGAPGYEPVEAALRERLEELKGK